jgi:hypothetical protein
MQFDQLVSRKLTSFFGEFDLIKVEVRADYVRYESNKIVVSLSHDRRDKSNTIWIVQKGSEAVEVDNHVLKFFFGSELEFNNLPIEHFVENVMLFFKGDGRALLQTALGTLDKLEKFSVERSRKHSEDLLMHQYIAMANREWRQGNYSNVLKYLDNVNKDNLPESLKLRYRIAMRKCK